MLNKDILLDKKEINQ